MRTEYRGPSRTDEIRIGDRTIRVVRPVEPDRLLDDPDVAHLNRDQDYMPYWAYLWPGAYLLAEAVASRSWLGGESCLEIGCGLGLAGLVALSRGLKVHFTDYDEAPLEFVGRSAEANGIKPGRFTTARFDWRVPAPETYPVILGADVLYESRLIPLVAGVLAAMLAADGEALIADPYRAAAERFRDTVSSLGLHCSVEPIEAKTREFGPVRGTLHRVRRHASSVVSADRIAEATDVEHT